ncbi:MAG: hypothetical protein M3063_13810 [Actinomycetota bacterium]|nr:hypothetical protein [Actinomycetota bacterium]
MRTLHGRTSWVARSLARQHPQVRVLCAGAADYGAALRLGHPAAKRE